MLLTINDRSSYQITQRTYTDAGFLRVPGNVARIGIQKYLASELGLPGDQNRVVNVYRPAEEVFKQESLDSYLVADVTNDHPSGLVSADNYKRVSVGVVASAGVRVGDYVQCELLFKDSATIKLIESGKCGLSAGYSAFYDEVSGVTDDGEPYEYIQRDIKINHVAAVYNPRAGALARVLDNQTGGYMPTFIVTDSGRSVDVADPANAQVVADAFDRLNIKLTAADAASQVAQAAADAAAEKLAAAVLLSSDEAIASRVAAIGEKLAIARKIAGDSFECSSVDTVEIMRAALAVKRPSVEWGDKAPAYVQAAFDMAAEEPAEESPKGKESSDSALLIQLRQLAADASTTVKKEEQAISSYDAFKIKQSNAWKGKGA